MKSDDFTNNQREARWREELDAQPLEAVERDFVRGFYSSPTAEVPRKFVRNYIDDRHRERDETRRESEERQTKHGSWMLILLAFATILAIAGFVPSPQQ